MGRKLLFFILLIAFNSRADKIDIQEAVDKNLIELELKGLGSYSGDVLQVRIKNISKTKLEIAIPAGRRFLSDDESDQDLLLCKDALLAVNKGKMDSTALFVFCCQASNHGPAKGAGFSLGKIADEKLLALAKHVNESSYSKHIIQDAVWVVSDDKEMYTVHSGDEEELGKMHRFLNKLTGKPIPDYTVDYENGGEGSAAFNPQPKEFHHEIEYTVRTSTTVTCIIVDKNGRVFRRVLDKQPIRPGDYYFNIDIETKGITGEFTLKFYEGDQLKIKRKFEL